MNDLGRISLVKFYTSAFVYQVHTTADIHRTEDSDSGHSSTYEGPGQPAFGGVGHDEYLVPFAPHGQLQTGNKPRSGSPSQCSPADSTAGSSKRVHEVPQLQQISPAKDEDTHCSSITGLCPKDVNRFSQNQRHTGQMEQDGFKITDIVSSNISALPTTSTQVLNVPVPMKPTKQYNDKPRFTGKTRVYNAEGFSGSEDKNSQSSTVLSSSKSSSPNPPIKSQLHPNSSSSEPFSVQNFNNGSIGDGTSHHLPTRENESQQTESERPGIVLSNTSTGHSRHESSRESSPHPDYRTLLEDITETDILV